MRNCTPGAVRRPSVDPSALATLEHQNWIEYLAASVSLRPDGLVIRDHGIVTLLSHVPIRFFNQILVEDPAATASAIREGVTLGRANGDPFVVSLREGRPVRAADDGARPGGVGRCLDAGDGAPPGARS